MKSVRVVQYAKGRFRGLKTFNLILHITSNSEVRVVEIELCSFYQEDLIGAYLRYGRPASLSSRLYPFRLKLVLHKFFLVLIDKDVLSFHPFLNFSVTLAFYCCLLLLVTLFKDYHQILCLWCVIISPQLYTIRVN